jgi:hypothetical protein
VYEILNLILEGRKNFKIKNKCLKQPGFTSQWILQINEMQEILHLEYMLIKKLQMLLHCGGSSSEFQDFSFRWISYANLVKIFIADV